MTTRHYIIIALPLWGHLSPLIALTAQLLICNPDLKITALIPLVMSDQVDRQLTKHGLDLTQSSRLVKVRYGAAKGASHVIAVSTVKDIHGELMQYIKDEVPGVLRGRNALDTMTDERVRPAGSEVQVIIYDYVGDAYLLPVIAEAADTTDGNGSRPKIVCFSPMSSSFYDVYMQDRTTPPVMTKVYDALGRGEHIDETWRRDVEENTDVVSVPRCEDMLKEYMEMYKAGRKNREAHVSAYIFSASPYLSRASIRTWDIDQPVYCVGPLSVPINGIQSNIDARFVLNKSLELHGPQSVAYVSFGSLGFAPTLEQIPPLVQSLAKRHRPSIIVIGACPPDALAVLNEEVQQHGNGYITAVDWVDQGSVLSHPATDFFLTHGGLGSVQESLLCGVPMVFWPEGTDQALLANQLSQVEGVGIELVQIRRGHHVGRTTRRGIKVEGTPEAISAELDSVFDQLLVKSVEGEIRKRPLALSQALRKDLEDGDAWKALKAIAEL